MMKITLILMLGFGFLLGLCGINIIDNPIKASILIVYVSIAFAYIDDKAQKCATTK